MNIETPAQDTLTSYLLRELPGCQFRIVDDPRTMLMHIEGRGERIHAASVLSDAAATGVLDKHYLASASEMLVRRMRAEAIEVYGLAPELERAKSKARAAGHKDAVVALRDKLDAMRDENGQLPAELVPAAAWLRQALDALPRIEVARSTDTHDLEKAQQAARSRTFRP